jgi:uncharacterized protein (TIGR00369 family)
VIDHHGSSWQRGHGTPSTPAEIGGIRHASHYAAPATSDDPCRTGTARAATGVQWGGVQGGSAVSAEPRRDLAGPLAALLGIRFLETSADRVVAELPIRDDLRTTGTGVLHGGVLMALADTVGAAATILNLPAGAGTTTIESKTNFLAAGRSGVVRAEATPLHRGRRTQVWQTRITDESGRLLAQTVQTQLVLD